MTFTSLKLFSACLIVFASFLFGSCFAEMENVCYRQLKGMLSFLSHLKTRITYTNYSLSVILSDFHDDALEHCGFLECVKNNPGGYSAGFCEGVEKLSVSRELKNELTGFGRILGSVSLTEQNAALERAEAILREKETYMKETSEKKRKSYRSLGALTGAMIAVILY